RPLLEDHDHHDHHDHDDPDWFEHARELGLGIATSFELWARRGDGSDPDDERPLALLREASLGQPHGSTLEPYRAAWTLYAPLGGPLWLSPDRVLPITLGFENEQVVALAAADVNVLLSGMAIGHGVAVELLLHDRLRFEPADAPAFELEVGELWG